MNNINIFLAHIYEASIQSGLSFEECLYSARSMGYCGVECEMPAGNALPELKRSLASCGMRAASVYFFFDFPHDSEQASSDKMHRLLEAAAFLGADKVLAVPGFAGENEDLNGLFGVVSQRLELLCDLAEKYKITVTIEDFDDINSPCMKRGQTRDMGANPHYKRNCSAAKIVDHT